MIDIYQYLLYAIILWSLIYLFAFLLASRIRSIKITKMIEKGEETKYFSYIEKKIKKTKGNEQEYYKIAKLIGMNKFRIWNDLDESITQIKPFYNKTYMKIYCNATLYLFHVDKIKEASSFVEKIDTPYMEGKKNFGIQLCIAIKSYYDNDIIKSKIMLEKLSEICYKNYYLMNIWVSAK